LDLKSDIIKLSEEAGFLACGIAKVRKLEEEEEHLKSWLSQGFHGEMKYMENHFEKRLDPEKLMPGAKSVICFLYNYFPSAIQIEGAPKIARYAYGEDYHTVIKNKLHPLAEKIKSIYGEFHYRIFVDSAPVMERQWAVQAGLGWIGKNSLLLRKPIGSYFFIASILCDIELEPDTIQTDHCGNCTACIDACPTDAILDNSIVDASKCISYLTIELRDKIPDGFRDKLQGWVFGCDICQEVCPWNRFSEANSENAFQPGSWIQLNRAAWNAMDAEVFDTYFANSALLRAGFNKIKDTLNSV